MAIKLQQDSAKPHMIHNDPGVLEKLNNMTVTVNLFQQPPSNSLDLNVLDLGYFAAFQSLQQYQQQRTVDDLIATGDYSFLNLQSVTFAKYFVALQKKDGVGDSSRQFQSFQASPPW
jgi:hypothetical protein